jgi:serine/threonine-protein kinase
MVSRLFCEARAVAQIGDEHLVDVYDFIADPQRNVVAYVMEFLAGEDLRKILQKQKILSPARVARVAAQICEGLAAAHKVGVVHRDLKPDNIVLVRRGGESDFVKLVDFGIAQFAGPVAHRTRAGIALGSAAYMAPEQAEGKRVDGRADLYAVGVVMHELLTGEVPFLGKTSRETLEIMHATRVPSAGGNHGAGLVSDDFARLVQRCMAKRPEDRYQSADELRNALLDVAGLAPDRSDSTQVMTATRFSPKRALKAAGLWNSVFVPALTFAIGILVGILILKWL